MDTERSQIVKGTAGGIFTKRTSHEISSQIEKRKMVAAPLSLSSRRGATCPSSTLKSVFPGFELRRVDRMAGGLWRLASFTQ